jgi:hypothetical protein
MDRNVEIPRSALAGLLLALVVCLMAVAFLLGRQTAQPQGLTATPARPVALVAALTPGPVAAEKTPDVRIAHHAISTTRRAPVTVDRAASAAVVAEVEAQRSESTPVTRARPADESASYPKRSVPVGSSASSVASKPKPAAATAAPRVASVPQTANGDQDAVRRYLAQVDKVMAGTQSLGDANAFATELLQQSMQGDSSGFDHLLETSQAALRDLQAIKPPASCKEHHTLMVRQVRDGIALLSKVGSATTSLDTTSLSSLALQGKDMQSDIARFQELDRQLRSSAR